VLFNSDAAGLGEVRIRTISHLDAGLPQTSREMIGEQNSTVGLH
jgi:hypothetical protein